MSWEPNWPRPDEQLQAIMGRSGELPAPGNDRWAKSQRLTIQQPSYTFVNTGYLPIVTPMALQLEFSIDGDTYTAAVPPAYTGRVDVTITKASDVKSGAFSQDIVLNPGDSMPFCTLLARALTVSVLLLDEAAGPLFVHCVAAPTQTVDCGSITNPSDSPWNDVFTVRVPANTVGVFFPLPASPQARQVIIQNNSSVNLLLGFGSLIPSLGPPPVSNLILPGGFNATWESQLGAFVGAVHGIFAAGGLATEYATFTRGISV
jgi:hypothetical protein